VLFCPYGYVKERLWVKESYATRAPLSDLWRGDPLTKEITYRTDHDQPGLILTSAWKSPIFMPRRYSRILLEITSVGVQRLHEVTDEDIAAEGIIDGVPPGHIAQFTWRKRWNTINAKRGYPWVSNPFVWVIGSKVAR